MSYDLSVYLPERPDLPSAARAAGVELDGPDADGGGLLLLGGEYVADVVGPEPVEPGDVPQQVEPSDVPELADVLDACRWRVDVVVQGSAAGGVERAVAFCRALAGGTGIVEDPADGLWSAGRTHRPGASGDRLVDVVQLRWYGLADALPAGFAQRWLDLCRTHLPAALPVRFGPSEPPRLRLDVDGDAAFVAAQAADAVYYRAARPCYEGALAPVAGRGPVRTHSLTLDRGALADPALRASALALFTALAEAAGAFYAAASVERDLTWTGRQLYVTRSAPPLAFGGSWLGLPARPVAWSWFGPAYRKLVSRPLGLDGPLHRWSDDLPDADALPATWLPPELTTSGVEDPAARVPRRLRASPWDGLLAWLPGRR